MQYLTLNDFCQLMLVVISTVTATFAGIALMISIINKKK